MPFNIPGTESSNGEFLGRVQFDARTGFWKHYTRTETPQGFMNVESEAYQNPSFLMDFGTLEVGFAKLGNPPVFLLVPLGQPVPPRPQELNPEGKAAFNPAARVKVMGRAFGDAEPRYFLLANKTGLPAMEEAYAAFCAAPEAAQGMVPVMTTSTRTVEVKTPQGVNKFKVPVFSIAQWVARPETLGQRLVPPPVAPVARPAPAPAPAPANHVPPPAPIAAPQPAMADNSMPF